MAKLSLTSLGGAGTVTGSKHLLTCGDTRLLIDCGLFQGLKNLRELNWQRLPINPGDIDAVVLTHAHLDHCGYLPRLVLDGFSGRIHCSSATRDVAELILRDSAFLQEKDAELANRKGFSKHSPALPLYRVADIDRTMALFKPAALHEEVALPGDGRLLLRRAGHILGASTAQIDIGGRRILFSGDLGRYDDPVMHDPESVPEADYVVIESTYGNRHHDTTDPLDALEEVIKRTVQRGGTVVIPAFAVGRAQSLIHSLWQLRRSGRLHNLPVYLDSPMATSASELLQRYPKEHRLGRQDCEAACDSVTYVRDVEESKALSANRYPKVIISASGMATGGRVLHHLKAMAPDPRHEIVFAGFQVGGSRGSALVAGATEVKIHGEYVPVRARVSHLEGFSGHADSDGLMAWMRGIRRAPRQTWVVHGDPQASDALRVRIQDELGWKVAVPAHGATLEA